MSVFVMAVSNKVLIHLLTYVTELLGKEVNEPFLILVRDSIKSATWAKFHIYGLTYSRVSQYAFKDKSTFCYIWNWEYFSCLSKSNSFTGKYFMCVYF